MIKSPVSRTGVGEYDLSYLGKSEKGVYSALLQEGGDSCPQCRVWLLNEFCGQMEWVLKSNINLQSVAENIPLLQFANNIENHGFATIMPRMNLKHLRKTNSMDGTPTMVSC